MTPLELLFAAGVAIAFLSIARGVNVELFLGMTAFLLIAVLVDMWGFSTIMYIIVGFLLFAAGVIHLVTDTLGGVITAIKRWMQPEPAPDFDNEPDLNDAAEYVDQIVFDENDGDP